MAKVTVRKNGFAVRLRAVLKDGLALAGISAPRIELEPIRGTRLRRVTILSKSFEKLRPSERHDLVWRIVDTALPRSEQLQISAIYTLAPSDIR